MTALDGIAPAFDPASFDALALDDRSPPGSYQWWYFDALSDDGRYGLAAIFFVGGVFSALYADRLAAGVAASPFDHPMVNLALYDRGRRVAWVLSEYPREALKVERHDLDVKIGRSWLRKGADGYTFRVVDRDYPRGRALDVTVRFVPLEPGLAPPEGKLSTDGRHRWGSPAPRCRVEVRSDGFSFDGHGYHDVNRGEEPLHAGFRHWSWARVHLGGETRLVYDAVEKDGRRVAHLLRGQGGKLETLQLDPPPPGQWTPWALRVPRSLAAGSFEGASLVGHRERLWESSPFYARWPAVFEAGGKTLGRGVCEHVDLSRFARPGVRWMLRHRIYRVQWPKLKPHRPQVSRRKVFPDDPA